LCRCHQMSGSATLPRASPKVSPRTIRSKTAVKGKNGPLAASTTGLGAATLRRNSAAGSSTSTARIELPPEVTVVVTEGISSEMQFCCQRGFLLGRCGYRVWTYEPAHGATATIGTQTFVTNTMVPCPLPLVPYTKRRRKATLFMVAVSVCTPALRYRNRYLSESMQGSPPEPWFDRAEKSSSLPHRLF
jgi:hypothetical protein